MRYTLLLFIISVVFSCNNTVPEERVITTELGYFPEQRTGIADEEYRRWIISLKNTYEKIEEDSGNISYIDHFNIASAYINLKEPKQAVLDQFHLAQQKNLLSIAYLFPMVYRSPERLDGYLSQSEYDSMINKFQVIAANDNEEAIVLEIYAKEGGYDPKLVKLIASLLDKDQEFRISDIDKQQLIDQKNIRTIDSLFQVHGCYIGKTLVGEKYRVIMQLVIQHAKLEDQEKYLPVVHQAVIDNELPSGSLKLLIDRIYDRKYGYQIFGTQSGVYLADDETIEKVKNEFGL